MHDRREIMDRLERYSLTPFQIRVLEETMAIPKGRTMTYKQIAKKIGHPNAYRAVGSALKKNPLPIIIPCHRVIKSNGELGNYSGGGIRRKRELLVKEHAI